jgi:hypothetical protein
MVVEAVFVTAPTLILAHVTYQDANKDKPSDEWPHRIAYRVCVFLVRHHGRWLLWTVCTPLVLVQRAIRRRKGDNEN